MGNQTSWLKTTATIYSCGWQDTPWYYLGSGHYIIVFSYKVDGNHYSGEFNDSIPANKGSQFSLRYNPANPDENDKLEKAKRDRWLTAAGVTVVVLGSILYFWYRGW